MNFSFGTRRLMKSLPASLLTALLLTFNCVAQTTEPGTNHFDKDGLRFDYPSDWKLTDSSSPALSYLAVASANNTEQIVVIVQPQVDLECQFQTSGRKVMDTLITRVGTQLHAATPLQTSPLKSLLEGSDGEGVQMHGLMNGKPVTADIYWLRLQLHLVNIVFLRTDQGASGPPAFATLTSSLRIASPVLGGSRLPKQPGFRGPEGLMNGRALKLGEPSYPFIARQFHASGTVVIKVIIDESGEVVSAQAITGHPLLQPESIKAAKDSKFSPTRVCGEPVRVTGVIHYNFVAQ